MATTPLAVIQNALTLLPGILWPGATPSSIMSADGLVKLNDLLATWSVERLMIYGIAFNLYPLTAGTGAYTIGVGGTFAQVRPNSITAANIVTPSLNLRYALKLIGTEEWNGVRDRSATALLPTLLYNDDLYPLATLYPWPVPNNSLTQLELYTWQQLTQFVTINDSFDFPPGYERAITYNLAIELAAEYRVPTPQEVVQIAMQSKASLEAVNAPPTHIPGAGEEMAAKGQSVEASQPNPKAPAQ